MEFGAGSYAFGLAAGVLSTLSPCVLPILPILLGSAASAHRRAPLALAGGLALSYAVVGSVMAWAASALDFDPQRLRFVGAIVLAALGAVLLSGTLQRRFAAATAGVGDAGNRLLARVHVDGVAGQFVVGLALGVVWSPCVGPTLGAAVAMASQGVHVAQAAALMMVFGAGAALPVIGLSYTSRSAIGRVRGSMLRAGHAGKTVLGLALLAVSAMILIGADKRSEAWLVEHSPAWLTQLTTRL